VSYLLGNGANVLNCIQAIEEHFMIFFVDFEHILLISFFNFVFDVLNEASIRDGLDKKFCST